MCLFTHFAAGALAGGLTGNVWVGAVAGAASHAVLDAIPHYDHPDWRLELGGGVAGLLLLLLMPFASAAAVVGGIFGMLPDLENLFQKLGWIERRRFVFPSHTGLIPHGRELGPRNLAWQAAIFVVCFGLLSIVTPNGAVAAVAGRQPVMARPIVTPVVSLVERTVVRMDFPVESAPADWSLVDPLAVRFARGHGLDSTDELNPVRTLPRLPVAVAVPTRSPVTPRIVDVTWWKEPDTPADAADLLQFRGPGIQRSVPVAGGLVALAWNGGILRSLTFEVEHPAQPELAAALQLAREAVKNGNRRPWREDPPTAVANPDLYDAISLGAREQALQAAARKDVAALPDLFDMTDRWVRLEITDAGIYRLSGQDLEELGVGASSVHPASLRLYRGGGLPLASDPTIADDLQPERAGLNEVAIQVLGGQDGDWNLDDEIRFYAFGTSAWRDRFEAGAERLEHFDHPFAPTGVYWLTWGATSGSELPGTPLRVTETSAAVRGVPVTDRARLRLHLEQQNISYPGTVRDDWVWVNSFPVTFPVTFGLPGAVAGSPARYELDFRGNTDPLSRGWHELGARAWANDATADAVSVTMDLEDQDLLERNTLAADFLPLTGAGAQNKVTLENTATWPGHRGLSLDSIDLLYWAALDLSAWLKQLEFAHWSEQVVGPGSEVDLEISAPAGEVVTLWDVTDPARPLPYSGTQSLSDPLRRTFGFVREPGVHRHFAAVTENRLLRVESLVRTSPVSLRSGETDLDYVVIYPAAFESAARTLADYRATSLPDTDDPAAAAFLVDDIYNNFSGGQKDWRAVRNFLRFLYDDSGGRLRYACFLGNACRDYRNYLGRVPLVDLVDLVPTDERSIFPHNPHTITRKWPYGSDDGLVSFDPPIPDVYDPYGWVDDPDVACGRLPALSAGEAEGMVERAIAYADEPEDGLWRNQVLLVADDLARPNPWRDPASGEQAHTEEAETLANRFLPLGLDVRKIYATDYTFPPGAITKPQVRSEINVALGEGATIFHYIGHGAENNLGDEQYFQSSDISSLANGMRRPVFVAFSCDVGVYESPLRRSMAEQFVVAPSGGAIGAICASQVSFSGDNDLISEAFYDNYFPDLAVDPAVTVAEALRRGKNAMLDLGARTNCQRYNLMGEPAMTLPNPVGDLEFAAASLDTLEAGRLLNAAVAGPASGAFIGAGDSYHLLVQDSAYEVEYPINWASVPDSVNTFLQTGATVFRGTGSVGAGDLNVPFIAPAHFRFGELGRVRLLVQTPDGDHCAVARVPAIASSLGDSEDVTGPSITVRFDSGLRQVQPGASFTASLADPSGVALLGTMPGNSILLEYDETGFMTDVTESFQYDPDSYTNGSLDLRLPNDMELGLHMVALHASDAMGNVGSDTLSFDIVTRLPTGIGRHGVFPNPTVGPCRLVFEVLGADRVQWDIYSLAGRRIWSLTKPIEGSGTDFLPWDGKDQQDDEIANGTYLYVMRAWEAGGERRQFTRTGKLVIMR